jgi:hypothetical protein
MSVSNTTASQAGINTAKVIGEISNATDTLKKAANVTADILTIVMDVLGLVPGAEDFTGVKAGLGLLKDQLKTTKNVINATGIIGMGYDWGDPETRKSITKTWQKTANRATLTAALVLETIGFIDKYTSKFFIDPAASIGGIPIFDMVKNSLYAISAGFGIWVAANDWTSANQTIDAATGKRQKLKECKREIGDLNKFNYDKVVAKYQDKAQAFGIKAALSNDEDEKKAYFSKVATYASYLEKLTIGHTPETHKDHVTAFQAIKVDRILHKYAGELAALKSQDIAENSKELKEKISTMKDKWTVEKDPAKKAELGNQIKTLVSAYMAFQISQVREEKLGKYVDAIKKGQIKNIFDYKIEKCDVQIHNANNLITKSWISIAAEVGKIFMIIVGTTLLALSLIFPILKTPAVNLTMSGCSLVSNTFGLTKNLYRDVFYKANMEKMPQFKLAPTA